MVLSLTLYDLLSPKMGVPYAPRYANGHISEMDDPVHFMIGSRVGFFRVGGLNGAICGYIISNLATGRHLG